MVGLSKSKRRGQTGGRQLVELKANRQAAWYAAFSADYTVSLEFADCPDLESGQKTEALRSVSRTLFVLSDAAPRTEVRRESGF